MPNKLKPLAIKGLQDDGINLAWELHFLKTKLEQPYEQWPNPSYLRKLIGEIEHLALNIELVKRTR